MPRIDRRGFLKTSALGSAGAAIAAQSPAVSRSVPDIVVVGAGAFGAWTALVLRERGATVTLLDAFGPGNSRATSGGETRQIRVGYGDRELYSRWVLKAFERWKAREQAFGRRLLYPSGRLELASRWTADMEATKTVFGRLGVAHEVIRHDDLRRRYPQIAFDDIDVALLEPGAAVIMARDAIMAVAEAFEKKGGAFRLARAMPGGGRNRRMADLALASGDHLAGGTFVFACGPWLRKVFPDLLGPRITTPRREVFFFGTPEGDPRFTWPNLPNWSEAAFYGFPSIAQRGLKLSPIGGALEMDPDTDERIVSPDLVRRSHQYLARRFPAMQGQPIVESRVCQLENTADEHFLIDRHPDFDNVWIAGGGSGHGFKHGPVVGEYIADRATGDGDSAPEPLFRLKRATN